MAKPWFACFDGVHESTGVAAAVSRRRKDLMQAAQADPVSNGPHVVGGLPPAVYKHRGPRGGRWRGSVTQQRFSQDEGLLSSQRSGHPGRAPDLSIGGRLATPSCEEEGLNALSCDLSRIGVRRLDGQSHYPRNVGLAHTKIA